MKLWPSISDVSAHFAACLYVFTDSFFICNRISDHCQYVAILRAFHLAVSTILGEKGWVVDRALFEASRIAIGDGIWCVKLESFLDVYYLLPPGFYTTTLCCVSNTKAHKRRGKTAWGWVCLTPEICPRMGVFPPEKWTMVLLGCWPTRWHMTCPGSRRINVDFEEFKTGGLLFSFSQQLTTLGALGLAFNYRLVLSKHYGTRVLLIHQPTYL